MNYLSSAEDQVHVDASKRDWGDHDVDAHLEYHRAFFSKIPRSFDIVVDATRLPYVAITHIAFFRALCAFAREHMKDRLRTCRIVGAPYVMTCIYRAFATTGLIAEHTLGKITFESKQKE